MSEERTVELPSTLTVELCGETIELDPMDKDFFFALDRLTRRIKAWAHLRSALGKANAALNEGAPDDAGRI